MNIHSFKIILIAAFFVYSCNSVVNNEKNIIVFSCLKCSGCVFRNLEFISKKHIDGNHEIILDTNCYEKEMHIIKNLKYTHQSNAAIEANYGRFGNFIWIDTLGKKIEFMTDMNLSDYFK